MDVMVLKTQEWLNNTYTGRYGYEPIDLSENSGIRGQTGWTTIYALIRALQIEMGIAEPANNFGAGTTAKFNTLYPSGIHQQADNATESDNVYGIIQGALWCKGYSTGSGEITTHFYGGTGNGIKMLKGHAGLQNADSTVTIEVMKALLSMNQYVPIYSQGGTDKIRQIQQRLNGSYLAYVGLAPCDGLYTREMNKALIKVLQAIEGYSVANATGNFGDGTKLKLPMLPATENGEAIYLVRAALCCNGYDIAVSTSWGNDVENKLKEFQEDMLLSQTGTANTDTWMALLVTRGNPDRPSNGCDTRFEITSPRLNILKSHGYQVVGRYLTGGNFKELRVGEVERILAGGVTMFPIFQESGTNLSYFTSERGKQDAINASKAARKYGIPKNAIIYFAVDTDPLDYQITNMILPYFKALSENFDPDYRTGVYGTRNVCTQVCGKGYAVTSFVSDMSYGFSGNMGFKIPSNWNFDQYYEISTAESGWDFDLDKTTYSGRYPVVDHVEYRNYVQPAIPSVAPGTPSILSFIDDIRILETMYKEQYDATIGSVIGGMPLLPSTLVLAMTNFLRSQKYADWQWYFTTGHVIDNGFVADVQSKKPEVWSHIYGYICGETVVSDGESGSIDLAHMAATLEAYLSSGLAPDFWAGWGGDLATGMADTTINFSNRNNPGYEVYAGKTLQEIADATIGKETLTCNYTDFCCDFDGYKISQLLKAEYENSTEETWNFHLLSDTLTQYYSGQHRERFKWIGEELNCPLSLGNLNEKIYSAMNGALEKIGLLSIKGDNPSPEVNSACCNSFANYIYTMINE